MTIKSDRTEILQKNLVRQLFSSPGLQAYAVLDGASNPALLDHLYGDRPEFACLYRGELAPDIAECAPYLARLEPDTPFTEWLTARGWGRHWGIFAVAGCDFRTLHRHLRKLNMVYDAESHKSLLFRYYDPRVLSAFLPSCDAAQAETFFGPVKTWFAETDDGERLARFFLDQMQVIVDKA
ncbi:MAG: DUF4123 domain-containing protein [Methylobacter sp.]|jgi:Domain of unknown function (DUF4123)|uniref:DUF4123 domain-containing protein n=1 Tax=Methylobacter sp. TaxID=2051955 RepID=UPI00068D1B6D|nr:DUF4123 domain-containing protein [Methylobacter sp.]MCL7421751.1 DUF4123 domain-containing protein [Methylobacter sp.]